MHTHERVQFKAAHLKEAGYPVVKEHHLYRNYPSWSQFCDGELVIAGGFVVPYVGLAEAWTIPGPAFKRHHKLALQVTRDSLKWEIPVGTRRLQALVMADHQEGMRWAHHIGFRLEMVMKRYGRNGEDVAMFVMFPGRLPWMVE